MHIIYEECGVVVCTFSMLVCVLSNWQISSRVVDNVWNSLDEYCRLIKAALMIWSANCRIDFKTLNLLVKNICMKSADLEFSLVDRQYILGDFLFINYSKFYLLVLPGFKRVESHTALLQSRLQPTDTSLQFTQLCDLVCVHRNLFNNYLIIKLQMWHNNLPCIIFMQGKCFLPQHFHPAFVM